MPDRAEVGRAGEKLVAEYVLKKGFKVLARNWKTPRWGEIDIVAQEGRELIFIEVKTRSSDSFGKPFEAVNYYKLRTLARASLFYRECNPKAPPSQRIDVASVVLGPSPSIEYFKNVYNP